MEEFQLVKIDQLVESPLNPRHHYDPAKLQELADSIAQKGILEPLLVRKEASDGKFEIICGSRRYRAAKKAQLKDGIPVLIKTLTDQEVIETQTIENLQRDDLHPLDEADGYRKMMDWKYDVGGIAAKIGKSESYVYQRLKLTELIPEVQKAFLADKITAGHAILIARLQPREQKEAFKECFRWRDESMSVRELNRWINSNIHLDLNSASFSKKDPDLLPSAGPCITCTKRTGTEPMLFPDIQKKDTCTHPDCFKAKVKAFTEQWIQTKSQDTDQPPLRLSTDYDYRSKKVPDDPQKPIPTNLYHEISGKKDSCSSARQAIVVEGRGQGQVKTVCVDPKCEKHHARYSSDPTMAKYRAEQKAQQEKRKQESLIRLQILDAIMAKVPKELSQEDLSFIAQEFFVELWDEYRKKIAARHEIKPIKVQYGRDSETPMRKYIDSLQKPVLQRILMEMALIRNLEKGWGTSRQDALLDVAKRYRVDCKAIEAKFREELKEKAAAKKEKAKKKKKKAAKPKSGVCRVCGCTETTPCVYPGTGATCAWADETKTLCSACKKKMQTSAKKKGRAK